MEELKVLFDSSVLVAGMVARHPAHDACWLFLEKALAREFVMLVMTPTLAETHAALTSLPLSPRITPALAARLIKENVESVARIVPVQAEDYSAAARTVAEFDAPKQAIHRAVLIACAERLEADRLVTLHPHDYLRLWPDGADTVAAP